jgi:hypothetical protein
MKKTPIFVILFLLVCIPGLYLAKKMIPVLKSRVQQQTSDAKDLKGKITLAIDDWIGYYPISSGRMKKAMRSEGYMLDIANDGGDYPARMKKLREGELDFAVVTVDSYILNAAPLDFPATIVAILDESKGGDAMVAYTNVVSSLDSFKSFTAQTMPKIAYTPASPSQHLLKAISSHFNVPALKNIGRNQRVETKDSQEALKDLQTKSFRGDAVGTECLQGAGNSGRRKNPGHRKHQPADCGYSGRQPRVCASRIRSKWTCCSKPTSGRSSFTRTIQKNLKRTSIRNSNFRPIRSRKCSTASPGST